MGVVYKLIFPNGKAYIGSTKQPLSKRIYQHKYSANSDPKTDVAKAIHRFGFESVVVEELMHVDHWFYLMEMEGRLIVEHETLSPDGYNRFITGNFFSADERRILTEKCVSRNKGKKHSPEWIAAQVDGRQRSRERSQNIQANF